MGIIHQDNIQLYTITKKGDCYNLTTLVLNVEQTSSKKKMDNSALEHICKYMHISNIKKAH